jgi:hypothetical protein
MFVKMISKTDPMTTLPLSSIMMKNRLIEVTTKINGIPSQMNIQRIKWSIFVMLHSALLRFW